MINYITASEFLKQPKETQKAFVDWWEPQFGDLFVNKADYNNTINCIYRFIGSNLNDRDNNKNNCIPLFQIHHLIKFIEDKKFYIEFNNFKKIKEVCVYKSLCQTRPTRFTKGDLLQVLWQVAIEIAKEGK